MIPSNIKIIKIGESEVGIIDLHNILREVYLLGLEDEPALKNELLRRTKEKNYFTENDQDLYGEAFLREYRSFAETQGPIRRPQKNVIKQKKKKTSSFLKRLLIFPRNKS
jgi:hypothetical protein